MLIRNAAAVWEGTLKKGRGKISLGRGVFKGDYSYASRFEHGTGTNPEELIAAAHAGCFSMALSQLLDQKGYEAGHIHTVARVRMEKMPEGFAITGIELETEGTVSGIEEQLFKTLAEEAKNICPVSRALASVPVTLFASLAKSAAA